MLSGSNVLMLEYRKNTIVTLVVKIIFTLHMFKLASIFSVLLQPKLQKTVSRNEVST